MPRRSGIHLYDIETTRADGFLMAASDSLEGDDGDVHGDVGDLCAKMLDRGGTWLAHNGGRFDNVITMGELGRASEVIMAGSRVLRATYKKAQTGTKALRLRDTYPWWLCSLEKAGKWVGAPKFDGLNPERIGDYPPSLVAAYCQNDVEVLRLVTRECRDYLKSAGARASYTAGGCAVNLFHAIEPDSWAALKRNLWSPYIAELVLAQGVVRGGRTETLDYRRRYRIHKFDVKSSYPARWGQGDGLLPVGLGSWCSFYRRPTHADLYRPEFGGYPAVYRVRWKRSANTVPAPVLGEQNVGTGWLEAWLCREEMDFLQSFEGRKGELDALHIEGAMWANEWLDYGARTVRHLYKLKEAGNPYAKVFANCLHGKSHEHPIKTQLLLNLDYDELDGESLPYNTTVVIPKGDCTPITQPLTGATLLGRARVALVTSWFQLIDAGHRVYYGDTDSTHTSASPDQARAAGLDIGEQGREKLGQWAYEGFSHKGLWLGKKLYRLDATKRAKGLDARKLTWADYEAATAGSVTKTRWGLEGFKTSLARGRKARQIDRPRTMRRTHGGKVVRKDGSCYYVPL